MMGDNKKPPQPADENIPDKTQQDSYHAKRRRMRRDKIQKRRDKALGKTLGPTTYNRSHRKEIVGSFEYGPCIYGLHTVRAALKNPNRKLRRLLTTQNALTRLTTEFDNNELAIAHLPIEPEIVEPAKLDKLVGSEAVHQGIVLLTEPIEPRPFRQLARHKTIIALDQITDPHNVGAIMRSAVALGCSALLTTSRHSPAQSGVLAKSASGALDQIDFVEVTNLSNAIDELNTMGFHSIGLDSQGLKDINQSLAEISSNQPLLIVLGAEGKGLRQKTRQTVHMLARLDMPGPIKSLNVSNAATLALHCIHLLRGKST